MKSFEEIRQNGYLRLAFFFLIMQVLSVYDRKYRQENKKYDRK